MRVRALAAIQMLHGCELLRIDLNLLVILIIVMLISIMAVLLFLYGLWFRGARRHRSR